MTMEQIQHVLLSRPGCVSPDLAACVSSQKPLEPYLNMISPSSDQSQLSNLNDLDLGAWVNNQRAHMRIGKVTR